VTVANVSSQCAFAADAVHRIIYYQVLGLQLTDCVKGSAELVTYRFEWGIHPTDRRTVRTVFPPHREPRQKIK